MSGCGMIVLWIWFDFALLHYQQELTPFLDVSSQLNGINPDKEDSSPKHTASPWGQDSSGNDFTKTPRTTASFIPGYDWDRKEGFFDATANDMQQNSEFDFEKSYEDDWMPNIDD